MHHVPDPEAIAHQYDVYVRSINKSDDSRWHVETDRSALVLRTYSADRRGEQDRLISALDCLTRNKYAAPGVVRTIRGSAISTWGEQTGTLTTTFDDALTPEEGLTAFLNLGVAAGRLHALDVEGSDIPEADFAVSVELDLFRRQESDEEISTWDGFLGIHEPLSDAYDLMTGLDDLQKSLIHSHIDTWNLADSEGGPVLTGWDSAGIGPAILDLGFFLSARALQPGRDVLKRSIAGSFLAGYQLHRSLTQDEIEKFPYALAFGPLINVIDTSRSRIDEEAWWRTCHILDHRDRVSEVIEELCTGTDKTFVAPRSRREFGNWPRPDPTPEVFRDYYGFPVDSVRRFASSERAWHVTAGEEDFVLRLHNPELQENQGGEVAALRFLERAGHPAPRLIPTCSGDFLTRWGDHEGYTVTYLVGERIDRSLDTIREIGRTIATVHALDVTDADIPSSKFAVTHRRARYRSFTTDIAVQTWEGFEAIRPELDTLWEGLPDFEDLPRVLIHSDLLVHNLLRAPDGDLVLIDWDGAGLGPATTDIAYFLRQYAIPPGAGGLRADVASAFLEGYASVRTLSARMGRVAGCLHFLHYLRCSLVRTSQRACLVADTLRGGTSGVHRCAAR